MAITQRHRVTFTVTSKMDSETQGELEDGILKLAKAIAKGETTFNGYKIGHKQRHMVYLLLTGGMEAVADFIIKNALRESIRNFKDAYSDSEALKVSPAMVSKVAG